MLDILKWTYRLKLIINTTVYVITGMSMKII